MGANCSQISCLCHSEPSILLPPQSADKDGKDKKGKDKRARSKSPVKGKGKNKSPEIPSPKKESKLKKRGEEEDENKYIGELPPRPTEGGSRFCPEKTN